MQRSGAATRRFYAAFYQWTVRSTNPTTRCTGNSLVSRRKQNAVRVTHSRVGTRSYSSSLAPSNDGAFLGTVESLRSEEAQSHVDRPFDSLLAWGHVVRAKSKYKVKLEIAVPAWVLRHKEIRQEADEHEVKFRTPGYEEGLENDKLERLQLRGTFVQVHEIWRKLYAIGHTTGQTELEADTVQIRNQIAADGSDKGFTEKVISLPDAFVKPIGRSGTIEYFQTRYGVQAEQLDRYGTYNFLQLKGDAKQIQEVSQFLEEIRTQLSRTQKPSVDASQLAQRPQIIRHNDLRSEDLNYWQFVRREQLSGRAEEEFCLPESAWQRMKQDGDVEDLRLVFGVIPKELGLFHDGTKRCIGLNGNVADVDRARLWLAEFNVNIPQVQMDDEYLRIHAAATGLGANQEELAAPITEAEAASDHTSAESTLVSGLGAAQTGTHIPETESQARKDAASEYWYPSAEVKNFKIPDFLKSRVRSQSQSHDLLAEIQIKANLKALRYRKMPSGRFLQSIGTPHALDVARELLQQEIDRYSHQNSTHYASIQELELNHNFALMQPTHFAVVKIPRQDSDIISTSSATFVSECNIKVSELRRMSEEYDAMEVVGTDEGIRLALGGLQSVVDRTRSERSEPTAKLEVLDAGEIKASELGEYARAEKVPQQDLYRAALPDADLPKSYYAWVSIPSSLHRTMLKRLHALCERRTNVSIDWVNRVVLRDENRVAIKLEGYRLEVLHAVESISELLQDNGQRRGNELGQAKFIRFDLIEYANDGRLIVEKLRDASADDPWTKKGVLPATPHKETAGDLLTERPLAKAAVSKSLSKENTKLTEDMRTALRHISQPVALVTSLQKGAILKSDGDMTHFRGVTVSSFCTVTLSPVPVISFNLRVPSRSWDAISSSGKLRVHLLKASPAGAAAAHAFTQRYAEPHEPFEHLSKHPNALIHKGSTPLLSWRAAVQTDISARIMPDKCVQVGDHMIVVAEVRKVRLPGNDDFGDTGGLAYGMQGYRQLGDEIKPMEIGAPASARAREQVQAATSAKSNGKKAPAHPNEKAAPRAIEDLGPSSPILDQESLQQVLEASETSYDTESLPAQAAAANQMLAESLKAVREAYRDSSEASATPPAASDQTSKTTTTARRPTGVPTFEKAWGLPGINTTQNRPMSIWARSACRFYSSSSSGPASPPISKKILKTTVGDYLAQPPAHTKRYTDLIYTARRNERIEAALEKGDLYTPEEAAELADEVQVARRGVARELAVRNAQDLCAMLDEGRVVMSRVPFLESNLEQGLAVLLTEAKIKRDLLERGELGANEFEQAKASLMKHYDFIDAQLMRLRDMLEEDDIEDDDDR